MAHRELLFSDVVRQVLDESGYDLTKRQQLYNNKVGMYVAADRDPPQSVSLEEWAVNQALEKQNKDLLFNYISIANRLSHSLNFCGPSTSVDTMSSSSLTAIHLACQGLTRGDCRLAVVGGINLLSKLKYVLLSHANLVGQSPLSRSFGRGDGFIPGEAIGAALLKPLVEAISDGDKILAVIKSTSIAHAGRALYYGAPVKSTQIELIRDAIRRAGISANTIGYVEAAAHGSTEADSTELAALANVFDGHVLRKLPIGSVETNVGHAEIASAMPRLTKVILQMQSQNLFPTIKADSSNRELAFGKTPFYLQTELDEWSASVIGSPRRALLNSFGAGGAYASMILEEHLQS